MSTRVLVVEDDEDNRTIVVKILTLDGYEVTEAADGHQALELMKVSRPDVVLMDLAMPALDGWETTKRIKADPELRDIPVIALTAFAMRGDEEQAREAGCDDYLAKPARPAQIREIVSRHTKVQ